MHASRCARWGVLLVFLASAGFWAAPRLWAAADERETVIRSAEEEKAVAEKLAKQAAEEAARAEEAKRRDAEDAARDEDAKKRDANAAASEKARHDAQAFQDAERQKMVQQLQVQRNGLRAMLAKLTEEQQVLKEQLKQTQDPKVQEELKQRSEEFEKRRLEVAARLRAIQEMADRLQAGPGAALVPPATDPKVAPVPLVDPKAAAGAPSPAAVADASNRFAFDLYARLREKDGNLFFSPSSLSNCLAMAQGGARGQTATEMGKVLHSSLAADPLAAAWAALNKDLIAGDPSRGFELSVANALWGQKGYGFVPDYVKLVRTGFGAGFEELDFATDTEGARKTINTAIENQTREKIKDLIPGGMLTPATRLVLTNAIYFKGAWARPFMNELTKEGDFLVSADKKVRVPMMLNVAEFQCGDAPDCQVLRLLYKGGAQEMVLILPKKVDGLADVEKSLSAEKLADCLARTRGQQVRVLLPKFKVTGTFMLAETLGAMGMPLAFDSAKADFKGMNGGTEPLWIGQVIHKTFVDVNEAGTEAAAATAIALEGGEAPKPVEFHADHPFVFFLRDLRSGCILFMGRVVNPKD